MPVGRFVPSGRTVMSHALISASERGLPRPGGSARAMPAPQAITRKAAAEIGLSVDMFDLPLGVDAPARETVVMLVRERQWACDRCLGLAASGDEFPPQ